MKITGYTQEQKGQINLHQKTSKIAWTALKIIIDTKFYLYQNNGKEASAKRVDCSDACGLNGISVNFLKVCLL